MYLTLLSHTAQYFKRHNAHGHMQSTVAISVVSDELIKTRAKTI